MLHATTEKVKRRTVLNPRTEFPGIVEFSKKMKRNREHVWRVLKGQRDSRRLLAAWQQFQNAKGRAA